MDFDPRWTDDPRDRDDRERDLSRGSRGGLSNPRERERLDIRDVFTRDLDLPRGPERQRVWARDSDVRLRGSEVRTLATVGDGRPDRTPEEIHRWAVEHELPDNDGHVQCPDVRIEYEDRDGRLHTLDIEVETLHYRGAHASSKASSGFSRHSAATARVIGSRSGGGGGGGRRRRYGLTITASAGKSGGRSPDPRLAEELLR